MCLLYSLFWSLQRWTMTWSKAAAWETLLDASQAIFVRSGD